MIWPTFNLVLFVGMRTMKSCSSFVMAAMRHRIRTAWGSTRYHLDPGTVRGAKPNVPEHCRQMLLDLSERRKGELVARERSSVDFKAGIR
jgi:hypothetical protein